MMNKINHRNKGLEEKSISIFEIFILVISIAAFAYFVGSEFDIVSATDVGEEAVGGVGEAATTGGAGEATSGSAVVAEIPEIYSAPTSAGLPTETFIYSLPGVASGGGTAAAGGSGTSGLGVAGAGYGSGPAIQTGAAGTTSAWNWPSSLTDFGKRFSGYFKSMLWNAVIAAALYVGIRAIFEWTGWCPSCDPELAKAWASALSIGYGSGAGVGILLATLSGNSAWGLPIFGISGMGWGLIGLAIAFLYMAIFYRESYTVVVQYNCYPWKPNTGGSDCDLCNGRDFPCSEYKCQSLGQGCELLNVGKKTQVCAWKDRNDAAAPKISAWEKALTPGYRYVPLTTQTGDRGVEIKNENGDGCVPPFARIDYGIQLDKVGQCRIDFLRKNSFNEMTLPGLISGGDWLKEHSLFSLHGGIDAANAEGIKLPNGGEYEIFVRCMSRNGVANTETFVFKYCVSEQQDTTAPTIKLVDLPSGAPIQSGQTSREVKVYVDKPSDCRWSHTDEDYDTMSGTMSCSQTIGANTYYKCTGTLTGLKDEVENKFYFRCKSYPANADVNRTKNEESYQYRLMGTRPLVIDSVSPESGATIKDATQSVKVTLKAVTSAGYNSGQAKCWYKKKEDADSRYVLFVNTDSYQSDQELWFSKGNYEYTIRCCDLGGNCVAQDTDFSVDTDFVSPIVVRAYNEGGNLKIITDENAQCVYDTTSCSYTFEDGIGMISSDSLSHTTEWNTDNNFYIKCKDEFGNQPAPDGCSIVIRPFNTY
jgi:hypothetical protein